MSSLSHDTKVASMFGNIARFYDLLNHGLSLGIDILWRKALAKSVKPGLVVDLCAGTLDVAKTIHTLYPKTLIPALDFCPAMLVIGKEKCKNLPGIYPIASDAKRIPLKDNCADSVTIAFGIRNVRPRERCYQEILRILKPGGRLCILEFGSGKERIFGGLYNGYLVHILPIIGRVISKDPSAYTYLAETILAFPNAKALEEELLAAHFVNTTYQKLTGGIVCLHTGEKAL